MAQALVVRGGWEGHAPIQATDLFVPFLHSNGFEVEVSESTSSYLDLEGVNLVLQCLTMGEIRPEEATSLEQAVRDGMGLAGWHGGIVDSFRTSAQYQFLTGGQFVMHPAGEVEHRVEVISDDPITEGIESFPLCAEQYYVHCDPTNNVLATTTFQTHPDHPWVAGATVPAVWTRRFGQGRVFVCTPGHTPNDLEVPQIRTMIERGLLWASR